MQHQVFTNTFIFKLLLASGLLLSGITSLQADSTTRPDSHAPIGVMADHTHAEGEFMFSYRYMSMTMEDNRNGTNSLDSSQVLVGGTNTGSYMVAPLEMTMDMHMLGMMYASSDKITWMVMLPYIENSMDMLISPMHPMHANKTFTTESSGIGDIKTSALISLFKESDSNAHVSLGLSLPTGSIDEEDEILSMPALGKTQLPFPMQLGSGTFDLLPGITYNRYLESRSWGAQMSSVLRLDENDNDYTLGNRFKTQAWHAWKLNHELSVSTRLSYEYWDNINGDDSARQLPRTMTMGTMTVGTVPTVDPRNQGGNRLEGAVGLNGIYGEGEHRVALEISAPIEQELEGPQMDRGMTATFGYQKAFD